VWSDGEGAATIGSKSTRDSAYQSRGLGNDILKLFLRLVGVESEDLAARQSRINDEGKAERRAERPSRHFVI
jgi:hypothetical protein